MKAQEVLISRIISYPREVIFDVWTNADLLSKWFAPKGCTIIIKQIEICEGGKFHWCIKNPRYPDCWVTGEFIEIVKPSIFKYRIRMADENGNAVSSEEAFKDKDWPEETIVTVTFEDIGKSTKITINQTVSEAIAKRTGAHQGWIETLDALEEQLPSLTPNS